MKTKVILNPYSNRWRAKKRMSEVEQALKDAKVDYDLEVTTRPQEGITLAEAAVKNGFEAVVAAGGDGTINEVINGILRAAPDGPTVPFGVLPIGTANDFNLMAGLPQSVGQSAMIIGQGSTRLIDAGRVNNRFFINNSAAAMEPMVTLENIRMTHLSGEIRYFVALLKAIIKINAWQMTIKWDSGDYEGPVYLLSVCNSARTGGFTIAPGAAIDDGVFDIVLVPEVPKRTLLLLLFRLIQGKHVYHEQVTFVRTKSLSMTSDPGTPIHSDGEVFVESAVNATFKVLPGKVRLISPS